MAARRRKPPALGKMISLALATSIVLLLTLPFFLPLKPWFPNLESQLSQATGAPVRVESLHAGLLPRPYLEAGGVSVGKGGEMTIRRARLFPDLLALRDPDLVMKSVELDDVAVSRIGVLRFLGEGQGVGGAQQIRLGRIHATRVRLGVLDGKLGELEAAAELTRDNKLASLTLDASDRKFQIEVTPSAAGMQFDFSAHDWRPFVGPPIQFDRFSAQATLNGGRLSVSDINAGFFGGGVRGGMEFAWNNGWTMSGRLQLDRIDANALLQALDVRLPARGMLDADLHVVASGRAAEDLLDAARFDGKFKLASGVLSDLDFSQVIKGGARGGVRGGETRFEQLTGSLQTGNGYRFTGLRLTSGMMAVGGNVAVASGGQLSGSTHVEIMASGSALAANVTVGGTLKEPVLLPAAK